MNNQFISPEIEEQCAFAAYRLFAREPNIKRVAYRWNKAPQRTREEFLEIVRVVLKTAVSMQGDYYD